MKYFIAALGSLSIFLALSLIQPVLGEDAKTEAPKEEKTAETVLEAPAKKRVLKVQCLADEEVLAELRNRTADVDAKDKDLVRREEELKAKESALAQEIKTLQDLKNEIKQIEQLQGAKQQENVARMVEMVENMSPKAAALVLSKLTDSIAIAAMKQLPAQKLAKIMNSIEPARASKLSEMLATDGLSKSKGDGT